MKCSTGSSVTHGSDRMCCAPSQEITDTERLEWMIENMIAFEEWDGEYRIRNSHGEWLCDFCISPRAAIDAAMMKESEEKK